MEKRHPEKLDLNEISAVGGNADFKTMPYAEKKELARKCLEYWFQMNEGQ
jgi:hypothetical protein